VASVNLNDPFFQHRDIHFILDLDAKEMFDEAINYVTVNVRKARSGGRDFEDHVTLDANFVRDNGITASVTYARGEDTNPDVYEYQAQWSLRGGKVYPENPPWQQGSWEGVTLSPPVVPRTLELEGDPEELKESGITRVTAQVRYWKFDREVEDNIQLSARGEPLVEKRLFMDRGSNGYAYRLVFNHRREGKLALPWTAQVGDNYIYAAVPEDLRQEEPEAITEAKQAAKDAAGDAAKNVLDRFKELLPGDSEG
jgi:hypothetical protein